MKLIFENEHFEYQGFGGCDSHCQLKVFGSSIGPVVYLHDPSSNNGTSVTNCIESLATGIEATLLPRLPGKVVRGKTIFITSSDHDLRPTFSLVNMSYRPGPEGWTYYHPKWHYLAATEEEALDKLAQTLLLHNSQQGPVPVQ